MRGVAAERSAQRACERSSDWRRGAAGSPDPELVTSDPELVSDAELVWSRPRPGTVILIDVMTPLRLGYKASAEQFGPVEFAGHQLQL